MLYMSKQQFNNFLLEKLQDWFIVNIKQGNRYRFYSDDIEQLKSIVEALDTISTSTLTFLNTEINYIEIDSIKLLYVNDIDNTMNQHFISTLRDEVSSQKENLENCSLLILHTSQLDTLINSSTDLTIKDKPLNAMQIKKDIEKLINTNVSHKNIFKYLLNFQTKIIEEEQQSAFGYKVLFDSIVNDTINFKDFGLFEDVDLYKLEGDPKKIEKSLNENDKLHRKIDNIIRDFPNELEEKLPDFSPEFIKKNITIDDWQDVPYIKLTNEIENNKNETISFDDTVEIYNSNDFVRADSMTKAGQRNKNIIIFAEENNVTLDFKFKGDGIKTDNFSIMHNKKLEKLCKPVYFGVSRTAQLEFSYDMKPLYFTLNFKGSKSSQNHKFKILVLRKDSFYLEDIKNSYIVKPRTEELLLQLNNKFTLSLNPRENNTKISLTDENQAIDINVYHEVDIKNYYNNNDEVKFSINNSVDSLSLVVEGTKEEDVISVPFLFNKNRLDKLFGGNKDIEFNKTKNRAIIENREFKLIAERLTYIRLEQDFIDKELFSDVKESLCIENLKDIDSEIYISYKNLLTYLKEHKTTPSLCAWNDNLCALANSFIDSYLKYMKDIEEDTPLTENQKKLFELGFVAIENRKMVSPFSPLVLSYILHLVDEAKKDETYKDLSNVTLNRLNAKGLFPYLYVNKEEYAFTKVISDDVLWLEFVLNEDNEFSYVKKLTHEKIVEFIDSFRQLFEFRKDAPLIINSINNSTNKELFEGMLEYYKNNFSKTPIKMVINLYDEEYIETAFDIFADTDKYEDIKTRNNLNIDAENIIDTIRTHVTYSKHLITEEQEYCHLSFFKNNEKVIIKDRKIQQTKSGLVTKGLISGESSQKEKGNYYSGFGLSNIDDINAKHLQLAKIYNAMQRPVYDYGTNYESDKTISLMISENFKKLLSQSYNNALWTVIIDPKVTLEFFNNEEQLILIHYSDQYSSSANYDAVTVTAQKELYSNVILTDNDTIDKENIVKQFNAFNGEWLIKMITENEKIKKERVSIIAAYKYITAMLDTSDITWVPLSVAEMIRVSGNVGLSMSDSDFTRYNQRKIDKFLNKGAISDDILLVGFTKDGVILYPVEVKSSSGDMVKAQEQAKSLKRFFYEHLFEGDSFKTKLLKGLFIRQVFMQVEKYELYDIFNNDYFDELYKEREYLLEGTYKLKELESHSSGAVVAFLNSQHDTKYDIKDTILEIKLPYEYQNQMLELSYAVLKKKLLDEEFGTNKKYMISSNQLEDSSKALEIKIEENLELEKDTEIVISEEFENKQEDEKEIIQSTEPIEIKFGVHNLNHQDILWHPTNTIENQNTNTGIIGTMGTGKTQFTKSLVTQLVNQSNNNVSGSKIDIIIFDYKGDYIGEDFVKATDATVYELEKLPFNPLALFGGKPKLPTHTGRTLTTTLSKAFSLGNVQKSILKNVIQDAYREKGISSSDKSTWDLDAPTLDDVWELYSQREDTKQDSLYAALDDLIDFEIFESDSSLTKSLYDVIDGVTVINLSGYDSNIQNLVVAIILDLFYVQMHNHGSSKIDGDYRQITKMILVDEADNFMSQDFDSLKKILKEGREFGVGTILSTQELTHFKTAEDNYANYIFTWIIHKVSNIKTQDIQSIFNINGKSEAEDLMSQVRELQKHYSFYVDGNKKVDKMRDLAFWELMEF